MKYTKRRMHDHTAHGYADRGLPEAGGLTEARRLLGRRAGGDRRAGGLRDLGHRPDLRAGSPCL